MMALILASTASAPESVELRLGAAMRSYIELSLDSILNMCGGDPACRTRAFRSKDREIKPVVEAIRCNNSGSYPRQTRNCQFSIPRKPNAPLTCSVTFRETSGDHSTYFSDDRLPDRQADLPNETGTTSELFGDSNMQCTPALTTLLN